MIRRRVMLAVASVGAAAAVGGGMAAAKDGMLGLEGPFDLAVKMRGHHVVPGPGDTDGRAALGLNLDRAQRRICFELHARRLDPITGASLHKGSPRRTGPARVMLFEDPAGRPGTGQHSGCVDGVEPRTMRKIWRSLGGVRVNGELRARARRAWYAEVRTTTFPAGAVRGGIGAGVACPTCVLEPQQAGR